MAGPDRAGIAAALGQVGRGGPSGFIFYFGTAPAGQGNQPGIHGNGRDGRKGRTEGREYILDSMEDAEHIHSSLYNSYDEFNDLYHYLSDEINVYMEYRLDNYGGNTSVSYSGIEDFMSRIFVNYSQVSSMSVYSYAQEIETVYEKDGTSRWSAVLVMVRL